MRAPKGLTLIETLIAIFILVVLMTVVAQSLLPLFGLTRRSQTQFDANLRAQRVVEAIRVAWRDPDKYRRTCATLPLPPGVDIQVQALDKRAQPTGALGFSTDCSTAIPDPTSVPAKRVTVRVRDREGQVRASLTLDVRGP